MSQQSSTATRSTHVITDFGAVGDGRTLNTEAIQAAIDTLGEHGGTVIVPPGIFITGTIHLRDGLTLELQPGGVLKGSPRLEDYRQRQWGQHQDRTPWHLIVAQGCRDIKLTGGGTIDGNGPAFWEPCTNDPARGPMPVDELDPITCHPARESDPRRAELTWIIANKGARPSPMIEITGCRDVRLQDIHISNSAGWNLHLHCCDFVWIRGVKLTANLKGPNNDGFDITGCRDVMISDCHLSCCDDAIVLKTTPDARSCERITVTNCVIRTPCAALKFGANESFHDFRSVTFSNCVVYESSRAVALYMLRGATIEDVAISNIVCDTKNRFTMNRPIHIDCRRKNPDTRLGCIRNVIISNVVARTDGRIVMTSEPDAPLENITLRDIQMIYPTVDDPAILGGTTGGGQFSNATPQAQAARGVVVAQNMKNLVIDNLQVTWPATDATGRMLTPDDWHCDLKASNGSTELYPRAQFNTDTLPPFPVLWARNVRGGYVRCPMAEPSTPGTPRYDLQETSLADLQPGA